MNCQHSQRLIMFFAEEQNDHYFYHYLFPSSFIWGAYSVALGLKTLGLLM